MQLGLKVKQLFLRKKCKNNNINNKKTGQQNQPTNKPLKFDYTVQEWHLLLLLVKHKKYEKEDANWNTSHKSL